MNCWGEKRMDTSNAERELFTVMVISSVHGVACERLTCQHLRGAYSTNVLLVRHPSTAAYSQIWHQGSV